MARGSQHHTSLSLSAKIHGDIGKDMQKGVEAAQAGVRRGQRSGGKGQESESSKGKRRFGNMMFEASRAAEDFGQQLSVSFDQAVRASANNITQMVAVSGNQYAAMATSVAVALYFMLDPIKELVGVTRQWGEELEIVEGRVKRVKRGLSEAIELREFEQSLKASLMSPDDRPDQWETQEANLKERQKDLKERREALQAEQRLIIDATKEYHEQFGLPEFLGAKDFAEQQAERKLLKRMIGMSDEDLERLKAAKLRYDKFRTHPDSGFSNEAFPKPMFAPGRFRETQAEMMWKHQLKKAGLPEDTPLDRLDKVIGEMEDDDPIMTNQRKLGQDINKIKERELVLEKELKIIADHKAAISKRQLEIEKEKLSTLQTMRTLAQEETKQEYDLLRGLDFEGYGNTTNLGPMGLQWSTPDAPVGGAAQDSFGANSGLRRLPNGRLISTGTRDPWQGEEGFALRAGRIGRGIGGAGFRSGQNVPRERDWAASGIGVRQPRTAREWRELGVRHESVGWGPGQGGGRILHDVDLGEVSDIRTIRGAELANLYAPQPGVLGEGRDRPLDMERVAASPWQRMPMGWGARGGSDRPGDPLHRILSGTIHTAEDWDRRETRGPLRQTGLTEREKRRFRASRGGGTASDIVNRPPMRIIEPGFGSGEASVSRWMDSASFWQGGDRGAAFVPAYPGSRAGSIGTSPSSSGMTPSQNRLLDSFWTGSGYQRSRYGAAADLDVQRGADLQLDAEHPVMSPRDQMQRDRNFEIEEQSSQYLKSISDNTTRLAQERRAKTVTISGGP